MALSDDQRFAQVIDAHSFAQEVRYGYGCWNHPLVSFLAGEATAFSQAIAAGDATKAAAIEKGYGAGN